MDGAEFAVDNRDHVQGSGIAALEKGSYRDAGLDVTVREWAPGINPAKDVAAGKDDFGVLASSLVDEKPEAA